MIIKSPTKINPKNKFSIFLAGTISEAKTLWQDDIAKKLEHFNIDVYNPRRENWNMNASSSEQHEQINWELKALDKSNIIIMNFLADSKSPISLLELGLYAESGKLIVCCPKKFYRRDNVEIVCKKHNIPILDNMDDLMVRFIK